MSDDIYRCIECGWKGTKADAATHSRQGTAQCPTCWLRGIVDTLQLVPACNLGGELTEGLFGDRYLEWM